MPFYSFECERCGHKFEVSHSMNETPEIKCPDCNSKNVCRDYSTCAIIVKSNHSEKFVRDHVKRQDEIKTELREDFGVHSFSPIRKCGLEDVYRDVKKSGTMIKDQMQETAELNASRVRKKQKEWRKEALKRTPARAKEKIERNAKESAKKNKICL